VLTAEQVFLQGGIIAYPTEAVFGLGCDPDNAHAIEKLLSIKQRSKEKGLILLAASYEQLLPYVADELISSEQKANVLARWPNGVTQLLPKKENLSSLLSGQFTTIAVRLTDQADVVALCNSVNKPIVSTSANLSGEQPAKTWQAVEEKLVKQIDYLIKGKTLGYTEPSKIIDALTGETIRA
jgi:L-threonylcarbamoyladenylate synthase